MNDPLVRGLSWSATFLCGAYILWGCYDFQRQVPLMAQYLAGLGVEVPAATRLVIASASFIWPGGALLILLLIGKEVLIRNAVVRLAITLVIFLFVALVFHVAVTALREPLNEILRKIG